MKYKNMVKGKFIERPNRFIAIVETGGERVKAHVKNTGRLKELLFAGAEVYLQDHCDSMGSRKLRYSLIGVSKESISGKIHVNIDSQAPNKVVKEALEVGSILPGGLGDIKVLRPEYKYGDSRLDFYVEDSQGRKLLMEVKGVTLEKDRVAMFPDAPTQRGIKHIEELVKAAAEGYSVCILFVIQMKGVEAFSPNYDTHKEFGETLAAARAAGVEISAYDCMVDRDSIRLDKPVSVIL